MSTYTQAALVADALSLGPHWVYNQAKISRLYTDGVYEYHNPSSQYHPTKRAGDFSHYGDQTLWLYEHLASDSYDAASWRELWLNRMASYTGYVDGASKQTIEGGGLAKSTSDDLSGASRIAPILDLSLNLDQSVEAARSQTELTHGDLKVSDAAEFFVRAVFEYRKTKDIHQSLENAAKEGRYSYLIEQDLQKAQQAVSDDYLKVSMDMGLTCHYAECFPLTLYFLLHHGEDFQSCINKNALAGGETTARAMLLALFFAEGEIAKISQLAEGLNKWPKGGDAVENTTLNLVAGSNSVSIPNKHGYLQGVVEMPSSGVRAFAIFAHCFTCGKDFLPEARIARGLAANGIATLRIDFAGLGDSDGEFKDSSFVTNIEDIQVASQWLEEHLEQPSILVGHSLGGAAVLSAASLIASVKAVVAIAAPASPSHVTHFFDEYREEILQQGQAEVTLAGRKFIIGKKFLEDIEEYCHECALNDLKAHKLIMHSPTDSTVDIENAGVNYSAMKHPKSFISLPDTDHLLTNKKDAEYVAELIAAWAKKAL